jgi:hypothetical protein
MRAHLDPLDPNQSSLRPSIQRISELSMSLIPPADSIDENDTLANQVRWAIQLPEQIRQLVRSNRRTDAESKVLRLTVLLENWDNVNGKQELLNECKAALAFGE